MLDRACLVLGAAATCVAQPVSFVETGFVLLVFGTRTMVVL